VTAVALHTQKAVLEATAFEIRLEFLMYVVGQNLALGCQLRHKRWVVLLNQLVKESFLGAVALVNGRDHAGIHASGQLHHDRILAMNIACRLSEYGLS
jgi:hypothetical protein